MEDNNVMLICYSVQFNHSLGLEGYDKQKIMLLFPLLLLKQTAIQMSWVVCVEILQSKKK